MLTLTHHPRLPLALLAAAAVAFLEARAGEPLVITRDTVLEKDALLERAIVVRANHVTLDGNGATLVGPGTPGELETFQGAGVFAEGCSGVTLRRLKVRGFETGLAVRDGHSWLIEECDFSDNAHDPEFGWGEHKRCGGIALARVARSVIRRNKASRVWNGLDLVGSHENVITQNDFSRTSNTCLKLWESCRNVIAENDLSWGIRIRPGEVHARDSASILLESGSDGNTFYRNVATHGGDGLFLRALNGWVSTGNLFVENDFSWANNNCVESWCPGNTWIRNRANHGSYGFWLGGSDQTVLIGNEAAHNGLPGGFHNAPQPGFGHGGIVIVGGSSSHALIQGNHCHHNGGAGIAFRGDDATEGKAWRTYHWVVQQNRLEANRWGIWGRWGDWIHLGANAFADNAEGNHLEDVTGLAERPPDPEVTLPPELSVRAPGRAVAGRPVVFDAAASRDPGGRPLIYRWDLGGTVFTEPRVEHVFAKPGFYRVGLTVTNGVLASLDFRDLLVTEAVAEEIGTEGDAARWSFELEGNADGRGRMLFADDPEALAGRLSLRFRPDPYPGLYATAIFPAEGGAGWDLRRRRRLVFWLKAQNPNIPGFQEPGPVVRLWGKEGMVRIEPEGGRNLLVTSPYSEARWTWMRVEVPLGGGGGWTRRVSGEVSLERIERLGISLDSWGGEPFTVWLDGLRWE